MSDTELSLSEQADRTIKDLTEVLTAAEQRRITEQVEYETKRDKAVKVAHQLGDRHSINSALDDLLEEFDLPRRPRNVTTTVNVALRVPITGLSIPVTRSGHQMRAQGEAFTEFAQQWNLTAKVNEGCGCDNIEAALRVYLRDNYGAVTEQWQYRIIAVTCRDAACRNGNATIPALPTSATTAGASAWTTASSSTWNALAV